MELRDAEGASVGATVADESGYYEFFFDATKQAPATSTSVTVTIPPRTTNWSETARVPAFAGDVGTLVAVDIALTATITSSIEAESLDSEGTVLTATVSGEATVSLGGVSILALPEVQAGRFTAAPYDGEPDYAGPSGHDFGEHTASDTTATVVEGEGVLAFAGPGQVDVLATATATSNTSGSGNVLNHIETSASLEITVTYRYVPYTCLEPGTYTIVQVDQPPGYGDGRETAGNVNPMPGSDRSDAIPVTVAGADLPENNFGELTGSLAGSVYVDLDDDGSIGPGEPPLEGVRVRLFGGDVRGGPVDFTLLTGPDGSYRFGGLLAGDYTIRESQPPGYLDGRDTIGSQGGEVGDDQFTLTLAPGESGVDNNFGERPFPTPTPTPTPTATAVPAASPSVRPTAPPPTAIDLAMGTPGPGSDPSPPVDTEAQGLPPPGPPSAGLGLAVDGKALRLLLLALLISLGAGGMLLIAAGRSRRARES